MFTRFTSLSLLLVACAAPGELATQARPGEVLDAAYATRLAPLVTELERELGTLHLPGMALAIVAEDRVVLARGFGLADVETHRPVTPETRFAIGSTTKAMTATLVAMLADEGRLSFDDPIGAVLPWFEPAIQGAGPVLVRDLLSHRTGFAHMDLLWYGAPVEAEQVLRTARAAEPVAPFRTRFLYNNVMYLAAGRACEERAGTSWFELVQTRLLEPLGMHASDTDALGARAADQLARGYAWNDAEQRFEPTPLRDLGAIAPAGAVDSTVLDLTRWVRFQLGRGELEGRRLVSREHFEETWKPHQDVAAGVRYGLGWFLREFRGQPYVEHGGNIDGFAAQVSLLPEAGIGVALLCNVSATPLQGSIGPRVFAALLGAEEDACADAAGTEDLARFTGSYVANYFQFHDARFEVVLKDDRLAIDVPGQAVFELLPPDAEGKRAFALVPNEIQADFVEEDGRVVALRLHQGGLAFELPKPDWQPKPEHDAAELAPYLGRYADPLTKRTFEVVASRGRLAVDYPEQAVYELFAPDAEGRWTFRATPAMAVEFALDADGRAEALTFHERGTTRLCERVEEDGSALPTLEELAALRGWEAFERRLAELGRCRLEGTLRFVNAGLAGAIETTLDASGAHAEVVDLRPFRWTQTAFDGTRAWHRSSSEEADELVGPHLDQTRANGLAALCGDWQKRFERVVLERIEVEDGKRTLRARLSLGKAPDVVAHVDLASGDVVRVELLELVDGGPPAPRELALEGWRALDGLRLPTRLASDDPGAGRITLEYARLEPEPADAPLVLPPPLEPR